MDMDAAGVSPHFAALVRRHELAKATPARHAALVAQLDDSILRPLLDEQLRDCVFSFAMLAQPTGSPIVRQHGLDPMMAYTVFDQIPVLPEDRAEAEELVCDELRRMASDSSVIPGAALSLCPNGGVNVRPVMEMKVTL